MGCAARDSPGHPHRQAAGAAAAQAIDEKCSVRDVNIPKLQKTLEAQNVLIHMTPDLLPKDGAEGHI